MDRFQGQQNDYILLSLVRTKAVGHLRYVTRYSCNVIKLHVFCIRKIVYNTLHKNVQLFVYVVEMKFDTMY